MSNLCSSMVGYWCITIAIEQLTNQNKHKELKTCDCWEIEETKHIALIKILFTE